MRVQAEPPWVKCLALLQGENSVLVGKPMYRDDYHQDWRSPGMPSLKLFPLIL